MKYSIALAFLLFVFLNNSYAQCPGNPQPEICDGIDNDCDGEIDEGPIAGVPNMLWGQDLDGDGFGSNLNILIQPCQPAGYVSNTNDCNDNCADCYPGAIELCDGFDNDCDGDLGNDFPIDNGFPRQLFYLDGDGDGFGGSGTVAIQTSDSACVAPPGFVDNELDCNDACADCFPPFNGLPGGVEVCDGMDNDCDGFVDEGSNMTWGQDVDGDGYGSNTNTMTQPCQPAGYVSNTADCNDNCSDCYPGAIEICDELDNDCDGSVDEGIFNMLWGQDLDGDGFGSNINILIQPCKPAGYVNNTNDCDDTCSTCYPGAIELCDGLDNDCDGLLDESFPLQTFYLDFDGDGFGGSGMAGNQTIVQACAAPPGFVDNELDCNDACADCFPEFNGAPGGVEVCNGMDNDCNGIVDDGDVEYDDYYIDFDGDGYGGIYPGYPISICIADPSQTFFVLLGGDCSDFDPAINPGAVDNDDPGDSIDNDCDGIIDNCNDDDNDGICNEFDICPNGDDNLDSNANGVPDLCEANDICALAIPISCNSLTPGSNVESTGITDEDPYPGNCNGVNSGNQGVWYSFNGTGDVVTLSTCEFGGSANFKTRIKVFSGDCSSLTCETGEDDNCGDQTSLTFDSGLGVSYYVLVEGKGNEEGEFVLAVSCFDLTNDNCSEAIDVSCNSIINGNNVLASDEDASVPTCNGVNDENQGVWYKFIGTGDVVTTSTCENGGSANFKTRIKIFTGICGSLVCETAEKDNCGDQTTVSFLSVLGIEYYILVEGDGSQSGSFQLAVTCLPFANDDCADAISISCNSVTTGNNEFGVDEGPTAPSCNGVNDENQGVWYSILGTGDVITLSTCEDGGNANFKTRIKVFTGSCGSLACEAAEKDNCGDQTTVSFLSQFSVTYFILVEGDGNQSGTFDLSVTCIPFTNDDCSDAIELTCGSATIGNNEFAADEGIAPSCNGVNSGNQGVWYGFQGTGELVTFSTCENGGSANFRTQIRVFSGSCASLVCEGAEKDNCGDQTSLTIQSVLGEQYYIVVEGKGKNQFGTFNISVECIGFFNDECAGATTINCGTVLAGNNEFAFDETPNPYSCDGVNSQNQGVWYRTLAGGGAYTISTCENGGSANFKTSIKVFSGLCGSLTCVAAEKNNCGDQTTIEFNSVSTVIYYFLVEGKGNNEAGSFDLSLQCSPSAQSENDEIAQIEFDKVNDIGNIIAEEHFHHIRSMGEKSDQKISVYPNPNSGDVLMIESTLPKSSNNSGMIKIFDMQGKTLIEEKFMNSTNELRFPLELNGSLNSGMYLISLSIDDRTSFSKFVIE